MVARHGEGGDMRHFFSARGTVKVQGGMSGWALRAFGGMGSMWSEGERDSRGGSWGGSGAKFGGGKEGSPGGGV